MNDYDTVINAWLDYQEREYGGGDTYESALKEIQETGRLGLAYTELGDEEEYPVQVDYDFNLGAYVTTATIDGCDKTLIQEVDLQTLIQDLEACSFDDFIRDAYDLTPEH